MAELAFQSEELELEEWQRAAARHMYMQFQAGELGRPATADELIHILHRDGKDSSILDTALLLPLDDYNAVLEVYQKADAPRHPKIRRRKR